MYVKKIILLIISFLVISSCNGYNESSADLKLLNKLEKQIMILSKSKPDLMEKSSVRIEKYLDDSNNTESRKYFLLDRVNDLIKEYTVFSGDYDLKIVNIDKINRYYKLHIPKNRTYKLIIVLHGGGGNYREVKRSLGFDNYSDAKGFVVAYPNGYEKHWNDGKNNKNNQNDVEFIEKMINDIKGKTKISDVYITGISNGAMMSYRMICEKSELFSGFAPVIGNIPKNIEKDCKIKKQIPSLIINGTKDPIVPYNGGECCKVFGNNNGGNLLSTSDSISKIKSVNKCIDVDNIKIYDDVNDGTKVEKTEYVCEKDLIVYTVQNGGHTRPPIKPFLKMQGISSKNLDATKEIVNFFMKN